MAYTAFHDVCHKQGWKYSHLYGRSKTGKGALDIYEKLNSAKCKNKEQEALP